MKQLLHQKEIEGIYSLLLGSGEVIKVTQVLVPWYIIIEVQEEGQLYCWHYGNIPLGKLGQ